MKMEDFDKAAEEFQDMVLGLRSLTTTEMRNLIVAHSKVVTTILAIVKEEVDKAKEQHAS